MEISVVNSNIVSAFGEGTIGAKVVGRAAFNILLNETIAKHDFSTDRVPGQAVINLFDPEIPFYSAFPRIARESVLSGIGYKSSDPTDYVCRKHRGQVHMFLKRSRATDVESLRAVVYTVEAYLNDPDTKDDPDEQDRINIMLRYPYPPTHVLVAVLAGSIDGFVSPYRFVANLAGGNLEYAEGVKSYADLVSLAKNVKDFDDTWATVAD